MTHYRRRDDLTITPRPDLADDPDMMFFEVAQPGRRTILVCNLYNERQQEQDGQGDVAQRGTYTVERLRRVRLPRDMPIVLAGDWNLHHPWWETMNREPSALANATAEWLRENGFMLVNEPDAPTFHSHSTGKPSVLDLVFVNECAQREDTVKDFCIDERATLDSDHSGLRWSFDPAREVVENPTGVRYNWKAADEEAFKEKVLSAVEDRRDAFAPLRERRELSVPELERAAEALRAVLDEGAQAAAPERRTSTQAKPWWNEAMSAAKEAVEAAETAQSQCKSADPALRERLATACSHAAAVFRRAAKKTKAKFFRTTLEDAKGNDIWSFPKWTKGRREYPTPPLFRGRDLPPATTHAEKCDHSTRRSQEKNHTCLFRRDPSSHGTTGLVSRA
ncbi:hypothetical protein EXIGLDRAFT_780923 [Exidia glandulosa HHB12029]|uniref:Endonuclease/exonuclease/phosphatase domain-containing protein n=1 Tax=Exidia glandulosa HHB12029 TaxID=1314781 RepID=A0A165BE92_EXIGL|nr:hypothetical protein EXIGLDRAFT_780923 [Exidia glandulosa HHB12029]